MKIFLLCAVVLLLGFANGARADESGTGFWLPGQMGSFAALPGDPGWSLPEAYYHASASASVGKSFERGGRITAGLDARADLFMVVPTYVFATPVAGAQAAVSLTALVGRMNVDINATLTAPSGATLSGAQGDTLKAGGDLFPMASLKWNSGAHNFMTYAMAGVPVGAYSVNRLSNLGLNHWSLDAGGGYTYLDQKAGHEFSAVLGFTKNFENKDTHYKNGADAHLDWAASQFISEQTHLGLAGYFYRQLTGDSGAGATLGDFKSQVSAIGPQIGHFFNVGNKKWYVNLKGFHEFDAKNRPEGWNVWLTLAIPLGSGK